MLRGSSQQPMRIGWSVAGYRIQMLAKIDAAI